MRTTCVMGLVLFLLGVIPAAAQDQTLTGWFTFIVADYPSDTGLTSETTYFLTEDSGEQHELLIDVELMQPLGGPVALNRKRVTVEGEWEEVGPAAPEKFRVYSIELAASPSTTLQGETFVADSFPAQPAPLRPAPLPAAEPDSSQAWVTILCRFGDASTVTPYPVHHYEQLMGSSYPSLEHYWQEVSYGNIPDLRGSIVVGWYNLPQPRAYYVSDNDGDGEEESHSKRLAEDCTAAADADVFFPDFYGINLVFNQALHGPAFGGGRYMERDGQRRFWGTTWLPEWAHEKQDTWAHEMGHAMGLQHSSGPYDETYDSEWDVMSGGQSLDPYPGYGYLGVHTIAYHKDFLGWIPPARKYVAAPNSIQTITLERLAQPGAEGYLMAQIPIGESRTDFYTVEARLFAGYDDGIPDEAIVIHKVDTTREDRLAQVVDADNNGDPNDEGAMWTVGETFTDPSAGLQVSVDAERATGFQVTIDYICSEALSSTRRVLRGRAGTASVAVVAPSGCRWEASSDSPWLTILTGSGSGNGSVVYAVAANPSLNARTGTLLIDGRTFTVIQAGVNDTLFGEDMESGMDGWRESGCESGACSPRPLSLTTASRSGTFAWTDSPGGNYQNNQGAFLRSPTIDLTTVTSATLTFWHRYDFASGDRGSVIIWRQLGSGFGNKGPLRTFTGTNLSWEQVSIDLTPFVGARIWIDFDLDIDATETADGWYIDDVAVFSPDFVSPVTLENPRAGSFQSGVAAISGWACDAHEIIIELNGVPYRAGYPTTRPDTLGRCGDTDNGFSLLWNWNNLGAGTHTVRALRDGVEFANTTVQVTTFGEDPFPRGLSGTFDLPDFPTSGETTIVQWAESLQNFVIAAGQPNTGGGYNQVAGVSALLENPSPGSAQSGVGVISGWACEAEEIVIELNGVPYRAGYPTTRPDTLGRCGDTDNGFSLLWNWNNLGAGTHTVRALIDGQEVANTTVRVTTFGEDPFPRGWSGTFPLPDFPHVGTDVVVQWEESLQNFLITAAFPTQRLMTVRPVVALPAGVSVPNVAVQSLYADTAEVLASPKPSLLLALDGDGTVLLGVANRDGGLQGERGGNVAVSVDSTAVVLVALAAGHAVHTIDQSLVAAIQAHPSYPGLIAAMDTQIAADKNFLDHLRDHTDIMTRLQEVASAIASSTQHVAAPSLVASVGNVAVQEQEAGLDMGGEVGELRRRLVVSSFAASVADLLLPTAALQSALQIILTQQTYEPAYTACVTDRVKEREDEDGPKSLSPRELSDLAGGATLAPERLARGLAGALQDAEAALGCAGTMPPSSLAAARPALRTLAQTEIMGLTLPDILKDRAAKIFKGVIVPFGVGWLVGNLTCGPPCGAIAAAILFSKLNAAEEQAAALGIELDLSACEACLNKGFGWIYVACVVYEDYPRWDPKRVINDACVYDEDEDTSAAQNALKCELPPDYYSEQVALGRTYSLPRLERRCDDFLYSSQ